MIRIRAAQRSDLPTLERLLRENALPTAGVAEHLDTFSIAEDSGHLVAGAGVEIYGGAALLRSVAVDAAYRNRGLGADLVRRLLDDVRERCVGDVFLLTTSATDYFRRFGFVPIPRAEIPPAVQASREFQEGCCDTAQAMRLRLAPSAEHQGGRR